MYFVYLLVLSFIGWTQQHLTYPLNYCNLASTCIHDNRMVCAALAEGCGRRTFIDQCDMYEYNCDYNTKYQETYRFFCITSEIEEELTTKTTVRVESSTEKADPGISTSTSPTFTSTSATSTSSSPTLTSASPTCVSISSTTIIKMPTPTSSNPETTVAQVTYSTSLETTDNPTTETIPETTETYITTLAETTDTTKMSATPEAQLTIKSSVLTMPPTALTTQLTTKLTTVPTTTSVISETTSYRCCKRPTSWKTTTENLQTIFIFPNNNFVEEYTTVNTPLAKPVITSPPITVYTTMPPPTTLETTSDVVLDTSILTTAEDSTTEELIITSPSTTPAPSTTPTFTTTVPTTFPETTEVTNLITSSILQTASTPVTSTVSCTECYRPKTWETTQETTRIYIFTTTETTIEPSTSYDATTVRFTEPSPTSPSPSPSTFEPTTRRKESITTTVRTTTSRMDTDPLIDTDPETTSTARVMSTPEKRFIYDKTPKTSSKTTTARVETTSEILLPEVFETPEIILTNIIEDNEPSRLPLKVTVDTDESIEKSAWWYPTTYYLQTSTNLENINDADKASTACQQDVAAVKFGVVTNPGAFWPIYNNINVTTQTTFTESIKTSADSTDSEHHDKPEIVYTNMTSMEGNSSEKEEEEEEENYDVVEMKKNQYDNQDEARIPLKITETKDNLKGSAWWYPTTCKSNMCQRPVTWLTTKAQKRRRKHQRRRF